MRARIIGIIIAALLAIPLTGVAAAYEFGATAQGVGATLADAEHSAHTIIEGDYGPCTQLVIYAYGQFADGTWWADISGQCTRVN